MVFICCSTGGSRTRCPNPRNLRIQVADGGAGCHNVEQRSESAEQSRDEVWKCQREANLPTSPAETVQGKLIERFW